MSEKLHFLLDFSEEVIERVNKELTPFTEYLSDFLEIDFNVFLDLNKSEQVEIYHAYDAYTEKELNRLGYTLIRTD